MTLKKDDLSTWNSQNFLFDWFLLWKVYNIWPKKSAEGLSFMTLKSDAKFEEELTGALKFLPEHWKVSKLGLWWGPFIKSRKRMSLTMKKKCMRMTMKNDTKFEEELTCHFKSDKKIWRILTQALKCFKNLHFNALLFTKIYNFWVKKVQKSYVWYYWKLMQNLKGNWLVLSKMTFLQAEK